MRIPSMKWSSNGVLWWRGLIGQGRSVSIPGPKSGTWGTRRVFWELCPAVFVPQDASRGFDLRNARAHVQDFSSDGIAARVSRIPSS